MMSILKKFATQRTALRTVLADAHAQLDAVRDMIAAAQAKREGIENAAMSSTEIEKRVDRLIAGAAAHRGSVFGLSSHTHGFNASDFNGSFVLPNGNTNVFEAFALIAPDRLKAALMFGQPTDGLSAAERDTQLKAVNAELLELEKAEELIARTIEGETGTPVPRRHDASEALLVAPDDELT